MQLLDDSLVLTEQKIDLAAGEQNSSILGFAAILVLRQKMAIIVDCGQIQRLAASSTGTKFLRIDDVRVCVLFGFV